MVDTPTAYAAGFFIRIYKEFLTPTKKYAIVINIIIYNKKYRISAIRPRVADFF